MPNAGAFWNQINGNILSPTDVNIDILESSSARFSGTYSMTGQDQGGYSGEFELVFDDLSI